MRLRFLILALAGIAWISTSRLQAQNAASPISPPSSQTPNAGSGAKLDKAALGKFFDAYATIAAGWYLDRRCYHLEGDPKTEFDWNVVQTNKALTRQVAETNPNFLLVLQESGRKVAETMKCGEETAQLVMSTFVMSRYTVQALTGQSYTPARGLEYDAQRITMLLLAQMLDDKCKAMPNNLRTEFDTRVDSISTSFKHAAGGPAFERVKTATTDAFRKSPGTCDQKAEALLKSSILEAREMSRSWKPN